MKEQIEKLLSMAEELRDESIHPDEYNYIAGQVFAYERVLQILDGGELDGY